MIDKNFVVNTMRDREIKKAIEEYWEYKIQSKNNSLDEARRLKQSKKLDLVKDNFSQKMEIIDSEIELVIRYFAGKFAKYLDEQRQLAKEIMKNEKKINE